MLHLLNGIIPLSILKKSKDSLYVVLRGESGRNKVVYCFVTLRVCAGKQYSISFIDGTSGTADLLVVVYY